MKYVRIIISKGTKIHHLNTDMPIEQVMGNISSGRVFFAPFGSNYYNRVDPTEVIMWREIETPEGVGPVFEY